jgi:nucleolysin TIA-1/TIAR
MNGEWLGSRAIRVNWANQKTQTGGGSRIGGAPAPTNFQGGPLDYETVLKQTPAYNTTVYVGNLIPYTSQSDLIPLFQVSEPRFRHVKGKRSHLNVLRSQGYGYIVEIRMQADRGFAFVKLDTHENAALAIVQLQNQLVHGRPVKCSWGKDREGGGPTTGAVSSGIISQQPGGAAMPAMMGGVAVPAGYPAMVSPL